MTDTITADERAALTLPGTIPGLLRRCSPVRILGTHSDGFPGTRGVCTVVCRDGALVGTAWDHLWDAALTTLALDLTDAIGQVHAVMWVADRIDPKWCWWELFAYFASDGDWIELVDGEGCNPIAGWRPPVDVGRTDTRALRDLCLHVAGLEVTP